MGLPAEDPGCVAVIEGGLRWLARAQDHSRTNDGGIARHFSLLQGWYSSYPETTGYTIPTLLAAAARANDDRLRERARRALDWLVGLQYPNGAFPGGAVDAVEAVPVTFNTGQILLGLAAGAEEYPVYREPMCRAADWLVATQESDGCWRRFPSALTEAGDKVYDTHVSWGLLEAARLEPHRGYAEAAERNIVWALKHQSTNGWFAQACLNRPDRPLTHTIAYTLRGVLELHRFAPSPAILERARLTADHLMRAMTADGQLPGRLFPDWSPAVNWCCLTGTAQLAACWLLLHEATDDPEYLEAAQRANRFVRCTVSLDGDVDTDGAVAGSFPLDGQYGPFQYLSWACKFTIDANVMELAALERLAADVRQADRGNGAASR